MKLFLSSYNLVRYVHERIETMIDPLVDQGLKNLGHANGAELDMVAHLTEDILASSE